MNAVVKMVGIESLERSFRRFQNEFWQDIVDLNFEKVRDSEEVVSKMVESDLFRVVEDFVRERNWDVERHSLKIVAKKGDVMVDLSPVSLEEGGMMCITPWSEMEKKLKAIERISEKLNP